LRLRSAAAAARRRGGRVPAEALHSAAIPRRRPPRHRSGPSGLIAPSTLQTVTLFPARRCRSGSFLHLEILLEHWSRLMRTRFLTAAAILLALALNLRADDKEERAKFNGKWVATAITGKGIKVPAETLKADPWYWTIDDKKIQSKRPTGGG